MKRFEDTTHVFIIRIWQEPRESDRLNLEWRGMIEYLATSERIYFHSLRRVLVFLQEKTALPENDIPD